MHRRDFLVEAYQLADLLVMVGAFFGVAFLQGFSLEARLKLLNFLLFLGVVLVWHLILRAFGLYESRRLSPRWSEAWDVLKATTLGSLALLNVAFAFDISLISDRPRVFVFAFWAAATTATIAFRLLLHTALGHLRRHGRNLRKVLVVGTNQRALGFAESLQSRPELGYRVIGFVDQEWHGLGEFYKSGEQLVSDFEGLPEFLSRNVVDEVALALPISCLYPQGERVIRLCKKQGVTVRFLPDLFNLKVARTKVEMFQDQPVVTMQGPTIEGWPGMVKHVVDFVGALVLLIGLTPLFLVVAALIKILSPGPVFFIQKRLGLNKRLFPLIKFRTMVVEAEARLKELEALNETGGATFKITKDPRLTPIGAFLRRTSIDELPQLLNVLMGDMSLVGPRPLPERDYKGFSADWHRRRFSVRPGLTCLWQISGRSNITFDRWMELDLEYIDHWTLRLDFAILLRTVPAVIRGTGAV